MRIPRALFLPAMVIICATPVMAHHAAQAQFDTTKLIVLTGVLTKMEWINPHAYMHVDVKEKSGRVTSWDLETVGPQALRRAGLRRGEGSIKVGDAYTFRAFPGRDGTKTALIADLKMPDGRVVTLLNVAELQLPKDFQVPK
jgi:hypothetical protein